VSGVAGAFPPHPTYLTTIGYRSYYFSPATPTQEPQPAIFDPVLKLTFPADLTDPNTIPTVNHDPVYYPKPKRDLTEEQAKAAIQKGVTNVIQVIEANDESSSCMRCQNALAAAQPAIQLAPSLVPDAMVSLCKSTQFTSNASCEESYNATTYGAVWTTVLYFADVKGLDGQYICHSIGGFCPAPATSPLDTSNLFPKPRPANLAVPKASGKRVKVLHLSDLHLDPRYSVGSEGNCSSSLCCRANNPNSNSPQVALLPASAYGTFRCDTPYDLALAALESVGPLTGTGKGKDEEPLAWSIYTGDLVSHEQQSELSRLYVQYEETSIYGMLKMFLTGPVFAALGNHDNSPANIDAPHSLPGPLGKQQSWNYHHVAGLWKHEGWIDDEIAKQARSHFGGYSIKTHYGLRIISFNTGRRFPDYTPNNRS
jgi:hypothetical protein